MRKLLLVAIVVGGLALPAQAQAAPAIPWGGLQIQGTSMGTNCHLNRCWSGPSVAFVEASSFWSVAKCGVAIGVFIAGNGYLIAKVRKAGGVYRAAKRIWRARGAERKWKAARDMFGYVAGVGALIEGCS